MKRSKNILPAIALATTLSLPSYNVAQQSATELTASEMRQLVENCLDPDIRARLANPTEICEVSTDDGKTWTNIGSIALSAGLLAGLAGVGVIIRRRFKRGKNISNSSKEDYFDSTIPDTHIQEQISILTEEVVPPAPKNLESRVLKPQSISQDKIIQKIVHIRELLDANPASEEAKDELLQLLRTKKNGLSQKEKKPLRFLLLKFYYHKKDKSSFKNQFMILENLTVIIDRTIGDELYLAAMMGAELDPGETVYSNVLSGYKKREKKNTEQQEIIDKTKGEEKGRGVEVNIQVNESDEFVRTVQNLPRTEKISRIIDYAERGIDLKSSEQLELVKGDLLRKQIFYYYLGFGTEEYYQAVKQNPQIFVLVESMVLILETYGSEKLEAMKKSIKNKLTEYIHYIIPEIDSESLKNDAWLYRDIAMYFDKRSQSQYDLSDFFTDQKVIDNIVFKQLGFEIFKYKKENLPILGDPEVQKLRDEFPDHKSGIPSTVVLKRIGEESWIEFRENSSRPQDLL